MREGDRRRAADAATPLDGITLVIVEDDFSVAGSLALLVRSHGGEVVGKAGTLETALELIDRQQFDVAIFDVDLKGTSVAPAAEVLHQRGGRFVFLTGYGDLDLLPPALRCHPRLDKPVDAAALIAAILLQLTTA